MSTWKRDNRQEGRKSVDTHVKSWSEPKSGSSGIVQDTSSPSSKSRSVKSIPDNIPNFSASRKPISNSSPDESKALGVSKRVLIVQNRGVCSQDQQKRMTQNVAKLCSIRFSLNAQEFAKNSGSRFLIGYRKYYVTIGYYSPSHVTSTRPIGYRKYYVTTGE